MSACNRHALNILLHYPRQGFDVSVKHIRITQYIMSCVKSVLRLHPDTLISAEEGESILFFNMKEKAPNLLRAIGLCTNLNVAFSLKMWPVHKTRAATLMSSNERSLIQEAENFVKLKPIGATCVSEPHWVFSSSVTWMFTLFFEDSSALKGGFWHISVSHKHISYCSEIIPVFSCTKWCYMNGWK